MSPEPQPSGYAGLLATVAGLVLLVTAALGIPEGTGRFALALSGLVLAAAGVVLLRRRNTSLGARAAAAHARAQSAEDREQASARLRRRLIDAAGDALYVHDLSGRILDVNTAGCESLGYTREELLQMHIGDIEMQQDLGTLAERWGRIGEHDAFTVDGVNRRKDGSTFPVEARLTLLQRDPPQILALVRDVTTRAQMELQLRQSQKMQAIGRLAGGVAHDFNSLLTAIRGQADLLLHDHGPGTPEYAALIEIVKAAERAAALTRQLLAFTRQQVFKPELLDPNIVLRDLRPMLQRLTGDRVTLTVSLDATGLIRADRIQLEQVLLNLVMNARDAMPNGGTLHIATGLERIDRIDPVNQPWLRRGDFTTFVVRDNGTGMSADVQARAFEPFFTTKDRRQASGLGLSTAYGIVKQSNGFIFAESAADQGTTIRVLLPRIEGGQVEPASRPAEAPPPQRTGTILVAEDEEAVRSLISRILHRDGYTVLEARDGEEALRLAHESMVPPDVLLSDIVMPRLGGPELARRLRSDLPDLRVILMSGYTDDAYVLHGALEDDVRFLGKPFAPAELSGAVRAALDG